MNPTLATSWNSIIEKINLRRKILRMSRLPSFSAHDHVTAERANSIHAAISELAMYFLDPESPFVLSYPSGNEHLEEGNNLSNTQFRTRSYAKMLHWPILDGMPLIQLGGFLDACSSALDEMYLLGGTPWYDKIYARYNNSSDAFYIPGLAVHSFLKEVSGAYDWNTNLTWFDGNSSAFSTLPEAVAWIRSQSPTATEDEGTSVYSLRSELALWNYEAYTNYWENDITFRTRWITLEKDTSLPEFTATAYFTMIPGVRDAEVQFSDTTNTTYSLDAAYPQNSDGSLDTSASPLSWAITSHSLGTSTNLSAIGSSEFLQPNSAQVSYNENLSNTESTGSGWYCENIAIVLDFSEYLGVIL